MTRTAWLALAFVLAPLAARAEIATTCAPGAAVDWSHPTMTLHRNRCMGTCPAYTVEIDADGTVAFDGGYRVKLGRSVSHIPVREVRALAAQFRRIGYLELDDEYRRPRGIMDGPPAVTTSIAFQTCGKEVFDDHFSHTAPKALHELEDEIDRVARTSQWMQPRP
jgi:Domain of unknown function (DUF6438)